MSLNSGLRPPSARWLHLAGLATLLALGACAGPSLLPSDSLAVAPDALASGKSNAGTTGAAKENSALAALGAAHKADPTDAKAALAYAKALRADGSKAEALAILDTAAKAKPGDRRLGLQRGLIALELGDAAKAETLLRAAHDPKAPDWRLHSALGSALAARGKQPEAQAQFAKALALAPDRPSILNNLALSLALDGKAGEAEKILRRAQPTAKGGEDQAKVQQNLALVLGLGGKYAEARAIATAALPADKAGENVVYLQKLAAARTAGDGASK